MTSIQLLIAKIAAVLALCLALFFWGDHHGAAGVQARWDAAKAVQTAAAANQRASAAQQTLNWTEQFQTIANRYQESAHETPPVVADAVASAIAAGALRLRDQPAACPAGATVSVATARSRAVDAAATQALADRVANSIAAVRAGSDADARERQLGQQVIALQAILATERSRSPTP